VSTRVSSRACQRPSEHRDGADALRLQLASHLMGQLRLNEAGLLQEATSAAIEDRIPRGYKTKSNA